MFNFKSISKLVEEMMPSPLMHLKEACDHPGIIYETGMDHNGIKIGISYVDSLPCLLKVSGTAKIKIAYGEIVYCIFVDKNFMKLAYDMQLVMFYHEVGHIVNGHLDQYEKYSKIKMAVTYIARCIGNSKQEYEADMYAALKTSKQDVEKTLNYVKKAFGVSKRDINARLRKLNTFVIKEVV